MTPGRGAPFAKVIRVDLRNLLISSFRCVTQAPLQLLSTIISQLSTSLRLCSSIPDDFASLDAIFAISQPSFLNPQLLSASAEQHATRKLGSPAF
jgi:hypothetical protein